MSRLTTALIAAAFAACVGGVGLAQAQQPAEPPPATSAPPATTPPAAAPGGSSATTAPAEKPKSRREMRRSAKQQKRADCRAQARTKGLQGEERKTFLKQCRS
jgi:hypothetical protein